MGNFSLASLGGESVKVLSVQTIVGPSLYHDLPLISMDIDLEEFDLPSTEIPNLTENILQWLPTLEDHTCSPGYRGGFIERLKEGTYLGHIIEHVALELSHLAGMPVNFGKTRSTGTDHCYRIFVRFENEEAMKLCLEQAYQLVLVAINNESYDLAQALQMIRAKANETALGPSAKALLEAAKKRNIPFRRLGTNSLYQLGYGKNIRRIQTAVTDKTNLIAADIAQDKDLTKKILEENFLPVPDGRTVSSLVEL
jgi:cyanophycin synthetase